MLFRTYLWTPGKRSFSSQPNPTSLKRNSMVRRPVT